MLHHTSWLSLFLALTTIAKGAGPDEIPFRLVRDFAIVVRGSIGTAKDLNILLDTGAVPSVISARLASRMEVDGERGAFRLIDEDIQVPYVTVNNVCLGTICSSRLAMVVVDLERFERLLGVRIDAVVGLDLLAGKDISIDYQGGKIMRRLSGKGEHAVPVEIATAAGAPYWLLRIEFGGQSFRVLLDTGANELGWFSGVGLRDPASGVPSRPLFMGGLGFRNPTEVVLKRPRGTMQDIDGILGPRALGIERIELDWEHRTLWWSKK